MTSTTFRDNASQGNNHAVDEYLHRLNSTPSETTNSQPRVQNPIHYRDIFRRLPEEDGDHAALEAESNHSEGHQGANIASGSGSAMDVDSELGDASPGWRTAIVKNTEKSTAARERFEKAKADVKEPAVKQSYAVPLESMLYGEAMDCGDSPSSGGVQVGILSTGGKGGNVTSVLGKRLRDASERSGEDAPRCKRHAGTKTQKKAVSSTPGN